MWRYTLLDAGMFCCVADTVPDDLLSDGHIGQPIANHTWEQVGLGLHPAPVFAQSLQKLGGQKIIAITVFIALMNMNDHGFTVDVGDFQVTHSALRRPVAYSFITLDYAAQFTTLRL